MKRIRVLPGAFDDVSEAVDWYNSRRDGLGEEFEDIFFSSARFIQNNPLIYRVVYRSFRRHIFERFPYSLYYRIHREEITLNKGRSRDRHAAAVNFDSVLPFLGRVPAPFFLPLLF